MTVEEIEIVVTAKVEEALKEFQKMLPALKETMKQAQEAFSKVDTKKMTNKLHQAVNFMKKKMQDLKKSSENNEIAIKVNNKDAQKQISQLQKQIDSLQEKINARRIKLDIITPKLDKIANEPMNKVNPERLENNKQYINLSDKEQIATKEIAYYSQQLTEAKNKMAQLKLQTEQTSTTQSKLGGFFSALKSKIEPVKGVVGKIGTAFKNVGSSIARCLNPMNLIRKAAEKISNRTKNIGTGIKSGIGTVLKYAAALFSLRSIYSTLSSCAQSWLSSQNAGAKQLSANINYMKYAMGSALAPIIQFVTNLVYQLMRAIQSVAYALTGVNIFAKASASSYASMAGSAKKAKEETKQLAGVHDEINNISDNNSDSGSGSGSTAPSFDLSQMSNTSSDIIDAIKNGDWYEVGAIIGEKLNEAMNSIPWDKIQNTAKSIGTNIAKFLNGFIATTDWKQVGNTFAQGINTIIYLGESFVKTFDWKKFGNAIGNGISSFIKNINWKALGDTLSSGIKGIFDTISGFFETFDWNVIIDGLLNFISGFDWNGVSDAIFEALGSACASLVNLGMVIGEKINEALDKAKEFFQEKIEECGGNVVKGIFIGIIEALGNLGQWVIDHIFIPFIEGFKKAFGIHSPSTVMMELGNYIIQGLLNGISNLVSKVTDIWNRMKSTAIEIFSNIKTAITSKVTEIKNSISQKFQDAYNSIKNIFSNIGNFFDGIWGRVKNSFSNLGTSIGNAIGGAVKSGINGVISLVERTINSAIRMINNGISMINMIPGVHVGTMNTLSLPRLAKGGVLTEATTVIAGEYSGARTNPEIVTPQNIMRDTFEDVLSNYSENNNDRPIYLTVNVGDKKLGQILLEDLRDRTRRTGKDIEALVGG